MNWEDVLKRRGASIKINYPVFKRAIEHVISNLDEFKFEDIKDRIASAYANLLVGGNHMEPQAAGKHARAKVKNNVVGRIINQNIKTHKGVKKTINDDGIKRQVTIFKRVGEEE
tara:strand:- start:748 stop:1089 length:342 start_codon:yes stop_codon:yes gene_type:complete